MIKAIRASFLAALTAVVLVTPVYPATFIVPTDESLIDDSSAIVFGTVIHAEPRFTENRQIETVYTIAIDEVLKGRLDSTQTTVVEWGGIIGGIRMNASGAPRYELGKQYLIFMTENRHGEWTTQHLTLGRFESVHTDKGELLVRDTSEVHGWDIHGSAPVEVERYHQAFRSFVRERVSGGRAEAKYFVHGVQRPVSTSVAPNFTGYDLDEASAVGAAVWVDDSESNVEYSISGTPASGNVMNVFDGEERIIEEDPHEDIPGSFPPGGGVVARAFWVDGDLPSHEFNGKTFDTISGSDVVTQNGWKDSSFSQSVFRSIMAHELGHTLGFRHSNCPSTPCTSQAIMATPVTVANGVLQQWDIDAVRAVYGNVGDGTQYVTGRRTNSAVSFRIAEATCVAPVIATQPQSKTVSVGTTTSLSVVAGGTSPFSFQWYYGDSTDTDDPVAGATGSSISITPMSVGTSRYWVQVSNGCISGPAANSITATVTATCTNPAITGQSPNPTITEGSSTQLSVTATGSLLVYQWYEGAVGDTSQPRGTNSSTLTVSPTSNKSYWVNVSGLCGSPVRSSAFVVTVIPCASLTVNPPTATLGTGAGNYNLNVIASSTSLPLTYTWFRGNTPGFGGTSLGTGQTKNVTITAPTSFWARVQNFCGRVEFSSLITLGCTPPTITSQPVDPPTINFNQTAQLSIGVSAGATVKWYRGIVGDKTTQIGTGTAVTTPALSETSKFWAEVSNNNNCPISSRQVTVTVNQLTELVPMLNGRFFVQVRYINQFDNNKEGKLLGRSLFNSPISDTAIFTFGDPLVVELMVRLSDARPFEDKIHLFLGGLSDVEFSIVVTDSQTGIIREYRKPANQLVGAIDRTSFPGGISLQSGLDSLMAQTVVPNTNVEITVKVLNNRFVVGMRYRNQFTNPPGEGYMNGRSIASSPTTETAVFYFDQNVGSVEWMVRFSDARPFANRIDMFHGGLSDVEFTIEVLDTKTGVRKEYHKGPFSLLGQVDRDSYVP